MANLKRKPPCRIAQQSDLRDSEPAVSSADIACSSDARFLNLASRIEEKEVAQPFIFANTLLVFERIELGTAQQTFQVDEGILEK